MHTAWEHYGSGTLLYSAILVPAAWQVKRARQLTDGMSLQVKAMP